MAEGLAQDVEARPLGQLAEPVQEIELALQRDLATRRANDHRRMHVPAAFVYKRRISGSETQLSGISADVKGKNVIIYDDMIRTGGSIIQAAQAYKAAGAEKIAVITTHGLFTGNGLQRLRDSGIFECVVSTDTHPNAVRLAGDFLKVKSIAGLLAQHLENKL